MAFCQDCEPRVRELLLKHRSEKKGQDDIIASLSAKLRETESALAKSNEEMEFYKKKSDQLTDENKRLQVLSVRAESCAGSSRSTSQETLALANEKIRQLEAVINGMEERGNCLKKAALMGGASAIIVSAIAAAGTSVSRKITGFFAAFGTGTLAVVPFLTGRTKKAEAIIGIPESDTQTPVPVTTTSGTAKRRKKS